MRLSRSLALFSSLSALAWAVCAAPMAPPAAPPSAPTVKREPARSVTTIQTHAKFCEAVTRKLPNVSASLCARAELQPGPGRSVLGHNLLMRDVAPPQAAALRVLVVGGVHGDELSSTSLVLHWIAAAMNDPAHIHWRFVPLMNPDGMLKARPSRTNANGVDLNRNFPTPNWHKDAPHYWQNRTKKDPRRFPGHQSLSEPETRWLHQEMERWQPHLIVAVHAPYGVLDYDGPVAAPKKLGSLILDQVGIFPGSLGNYGGVHKKVPVVTIELPSALRTPQEKEMRKMWQDLLTWTQTRLRPSTS